MENLFLNSLAFTKQSHDITNRRMKSNTETAHDPDVTAMGANGFTRMDHLKEHLRCYHQGESRHFLSRWFAYLMGKNHGSRDIPSLHE
jgi:hypothetical protein